MRGFSLVEVLVSLAIGAIIVETIVLISTSGVRTSQAGMAAADNQKLVNQLTGMISSEELCRLTLGGPDTYNGPDISYAQSVNPAGAPTNLRFWQPNHGALRTVLYFVEPTNMMNRYGSLIISDIKIQPLTPGAPYNIPGTTPAKITIKTDSPSTNTRVTSNIYLSVTVNAANKIASCYPLTFGTDERTVEDCIGPYKAFKSNGTRLDCRIVGCAPPDVTCGFLPTGDVKCQAPALPCP